MSEVCFLIWLFSHFLGSVYAILLYHIQMYMRRVWNQITTVVRFTTTLSDRQQE